MEAGCLLSWSCPRIYSWPGWWKTSELTPLLQILGVFCHPGAPLGAGLPPTPGCGWVQPSPARRGNICLCFGGPGVPPAPSPLPPPLFIASHRHLEFEPVRRWLTPSRGTGLGETCAAEEGGREGAPEPFPAACGGPQRPGMELRTSWGLGSPRSILTPLFPAVGELPCPRPAALAWVSSASPLAALPAVAPACWLGFEAPLTFAISSQPYPPRKVSLRSPWPGGMRGYNSPLSGAALMGKFESFLGEGE